MPSQFADDDDDMQEQYQLPPMIDKLTPLPDFVTSYHNPPDGHGGSTTSQSMSAPRRRRKDSSTTADTTTVAESSSKGFQYDSNRRVKDIEPSAPLTSGSSDEIRAMSDGMTQLLKEKIIDLGNVMQRVQNVLPVDLEPAAENQVLNLAIEYLHMSDHDGPASSKRMQSAMLRKVDSLGKLAKRLHVEIPSDLDRSSDMYDLKSYYKGHRGVDIYAKAGGAALRKKKEAANARPTTGNSDFQQALAALDPTEFYPDEDGGRTDTISGMEDSLDYDETISGEDSSSSLAKRGVGKSARSSAAGALTLARQQLVSMQEDKRRRVNQRRTKKMRDQRNVLNKIAESFSIRALPNPALVYQFGKVPPAELNSGLILGYIADSMRIVEGSHSERVFRNYFTNLISRRAFSLSFWQIYLIHFQNKSKNTAPIEAKSAEVRQQLLLQREADIVAQGKELENLSELLAATYVQLLTSVKVETHKPVFYRYYSTALSEAIYQTLYFYFPGSRNLYNNQFKRQLYTEVAGTLSGMPIYPVSAAIMSAAIFNHVIITNDDLSKKKNVNQNEGSFGGALPAGYSTKPRRFHDPSIWIPTGKRAPRTKGMATHISPLVRHFLGKPVGRHGNLEPLPTKRSKPSTTRYRLPDAFKMIGKAEDRMLELRANYNFKMNQFSNDKRFDRKTVKLETRELEKEKQRVLFSNASDRQRYAFHILDEHKKATAMKKREAELRR